MQLGLFIFPCSMIEVTYFLGICDSQFYDLSTGLEISTHPLAQASVKTTSASTNPRVFVALIKETCPMASVVKIKFPSLFLCACKQRFWLIVTREQRVEFVLGICELYCVLCNFILNSFGRLVNMHTLSALWLHFEPMNLLSPILWHSRLTDMICNTEIKFLRFYFSQYHILVRDHLNIWVNMKTFWLLLMMLERAKYFYVILFGNST